MSTSNTQNSKALQTARYVSLVASISIAIAGGTNYLYSAYAPQLADRLHLSTTDSNIVGTCGNLGMYLSGIPAGMLIDAKGPRLALMISIVSLFLGYYGTYWAYVQQQVSWGVVPLSIFAVLTGIGSCFGFNSAMKVAVLNFPHNRGTATAIPLAAYGLSAFFFSSVTALIFPGDTAAFLLVLALSTSCIVFVAFFFIRIIPPAPPSNVRRLHRTKSSDGAERGTKNNGTTENATQDETESLISSSSSSSIYGSEVVAVNTNSSDDRTSSVDEVRQQHVDIKGWALVKVPEFWRIWTIMLIITGIGLMTINNIGYAVQALWMYHDPSKSSKFIQNQQAIHVSVLSLCSFSGRILSGPLSDHMSRRNGSRFWLLVLSNSAFIVGQLSGLLVNDPKGLFFVSGINGFAYGVCFGVIPTITSESFGLSGFSQNWGTMTLASVFGGNIFNLFFGLIYDSNSDKTPVGGRHHHECKVGLACYRSAYGLSLAAALVCFPVVLYSIWAKRNRALVY